MEIKKRTILFIMALATATFISIIAISIQASANLDPNDLKLLHVIFRHGKRTPQDTYPLDPYINETFYPVGWGQLTDEGKMDMYNLGLFLRKRYNKFLGDLYDPRQFYTQTTDVDRTKVSAQLINAALWPPNDQQKWGPIDWQPIPIHSEPYDDDKLLLVKKPCPQYNIEFDNVMKSEKIQKKLKENQKLFENLTKITGKRVNEFYDVMDIYSTLKAEQSYGLKLPNWTNEYFPNKMLEPTIFSFQLDVYNDKLKRLKGGLLLKKLMADWNSAKDGEIKTKAFLYGGHDSTIVNILNTLNVWEPQEPDYGITILLEFSRNIITNNYGLQIFLRNTTKKHPYQLTIPGCDKFCPFEQLENLIENIIPINWEKECRTNDPNYLPPPQRGGP